MLNTAFLVCSLALFPNADKVDLTHILAKGTELHYTFNIDVTGDETVAAASTLKWSFGDTTDKGVKTSVKVEKFSLVVNGSDVGQQIEDKEFQLDKFGMPNEFTMNGPESLLVIAHVCTFLPAKQLEPGESFDVDWKRDAATLKGTGKFEGMEKVDGKDLAKLTLKLTLTPHGEANGVGTLDFTSYFDPATGHVQSAKGNGAIDSHDFKFNLSLVPAK